MCVVFVMTKSATSTPPRPRPRPRSVFAIYPLFHPLEREHTSYIVNDGYPLFFFSKTSNFVYTLLQILGQLGLGEIKDSRIGGGLSRGISGGEKRRLSIGTELLTRPALLFLDEPTTGLGKEALICRSCGFLVFMSRLLVVVLLTYSVVYRVVV